jgi:hypothetical protein
VRQWLPWGIVALVGASAGAVRSEPVDEQDVQLLLRLAGIERALPATARLAELLCIDDAIGARRLPALGTPAAQRLEDRIRRTFEQCRIAAGAAEQDDQRLVSQVRAAFRARVAQLEPVRAALAQCRAPRPDGVAAPDCLARALGRRATAQEIAALLPEPR